MLGFKPETQYTKSGRINIAYQVFGSGEKDLVYIPGWISNIDMMWDSPPLVSFFKELSQVARIILFDKRGTGLSDRVSDLSTLEERMDDIRVVMDAVESEKAVLFGHSDGGSVSALFSATYPQRTAGLITFGVFAKRRWSEDYPWAPNDDERQLVYDMIDQHWGSGQMDLVSLAPSMKDNKKFMDWLARYFRSGASPSAALALTKMNTQIDIRGILDSISVPTLLLYRTKDIDVKVEEGRYIAEHIKGSKFLEFPGDDHLFWAGETRDILDQMTHFVQHDCTQRRYSKVLSTLLKIKLHDSSSKKDNNKLSSKHKVSFKTAIVDKVNQYLGNELDTKGNFMIATFPGPSKAIHCAIDVQKISQLYGKSISQGMHIGEITINDTLDMNNITMSITDKILNHASENQILITNTVNNLLSGTGLYFKKFGMLTIDVLRQLEILVLDETLHQNNIEKNPQLELHFSTHTDKSHSLLENVMEIIENHFRDDQFGINVIAKELGLSQRQLQRKIKSITNKSPNSLIRSVRLHKAKELIIQDGKTVKEAAFMTGFSSISYFSSCFKKEFGEPPSAI